MQTNRSAELDLSGLDDRERVSLCEALDRVLDTGAVVAGEVTISVADVELIYLGLHLVLSSAETARGGPGGVGLSIDIGKEPRDAVGRNGASRV
ncbi:MAG TPA: gas vesicle protein [Bryobacteraceae bacterium]|nr:gas vesicle protein [Bryobacteraceae bacterium]